MERITVDIPWRVVVAGLLLLFIISTTPLVLTTISLTIASGMPLSNMFQNDNYLLNVHLLASMVAFILLLTKRAYPRMAIVLAGIFLIYYLVAGYYPIISFVQSIFLFNYNGLTGFLPILMFLSPLLAVYYISGVNWHQKWAQANVGKILAIALGYVALSLVNFIYYLFSTNQLQTGYMDVARLGMVLLFFLQAIIFFAAAVLLFQSKKSPLLAKIIFVNVILYVIFYAGMILLFGSRSLNLISHVFQLVSLIAQAGVLFYVAQLLSIKPTPILFGRPARKK